MTTADGTTLAGIRTHHLFAGLAPAQLQQVLATSRIEDVARVGYCSIAANRRNISSSSSKAR
jgi:hypothetical protein